MKRPYKMKFVYYRIPNILCVLNKGRPKESTLHKYIRGQGWNNKDLPTHAPLSRGGAVFCIIETKNGTRVQARATCSLSDNFCYALGRDIALGRAIKLYEGL